MRKKTHSLSLAEGRLSVDYASYLSRHDLVYNRPVAHPADAIPMGNGRVGAMIWNENGITMQLTNVDASPHTGLSQGVVNIQMEPGIETGGKGFQQRLVLHDGMASTNYGNGLRLTYFGDPDAEILGVQVEDNRVDATPCWIELSIWQTPYEDIKAIYARKELNYRDTLPDMETWVHPGFHVDKHLIALSRGLADPHHFGYTLAVSVQGAPFRAEQVDPAILRLTVASSRSYTIWLACPSRRAAPGHDSLLHAKTLITRAQMEGSEHVQARFKRWWHDFWARSFVAYGAGSPEADYLENNWYLSQYLFAAGARGEFPVHFINGVWRSDRRDATRWSWDYTYFNQRCVFSSLLASNHAELMNPHFNLFIRNSDAYREYTRRRFGLEGIFIHERYLYDGRVLDGNPYTDGIFTSGPEIALMMYDQYRYNGDERYLAETVYPLMRELVTLYEGYLAWDGAHFCMQPAHSRETWWNVKNPITDLGMLRVLFPTIIHISEKLNIDENRRAVWRHILENLAPLPRALHEDLQSETIKAHRLWIQQGRAEALAPYEGYRYVPHDLPLSEPHNMENVELELLWPFGLTGMDAPDYDVALTTYRTRLFGYSIWETSAIAAARLGLGRDAYEHMKGMILRNQSRASGLHDDGNGLLESNGLHVNAMNESLLQSYNDVIRVFPAVPDRAEFSGGFSLLAAGGFLVSSEMEMGEVKYIALKSRLGNRAKVINPWDSEAWVRKAADDRIICSGNGKMLSFATEPEGLYIIERSSMPLSRYSFVEISGVPNEDGKMLGNRMLGYRALGSE